MAQIVKTHFVYKQKQQAMNLLDNIAERELKLTYESRGYNKNGMIILQPGNYYIVEAKQYYYFGPYYVFVKQPHWEHSVEISLKSFYELQKLSRYAS